VLWVAAWVTARIYGVPWLPAAGVACGSLSGLLLAVLLLRRCGFQPGFRRERDVIFYAAASAVGFLVAALIGTGVLYGAGLIAPSGGLPWNALRGWWMGDWMGAMVFGPLFLTVTRDNARLTVTLGWKYRNWLLGLLLATVSMLLPAARGQAHHLPWIFIPIVLICAGTMRFGRSAVVIGLPLFVVLTLAGSLFRVEGPASGPELQRELEQDWMLVGGVGVVGWVMATLQLERDREARERRRAEATLHERTQMLRAILDHAPLGIWMQDGRGRLQFVNRAFCDAVGIPEARFLAVPHYAELYPPALARSCMAADAVALAQDGPQVSRERLTFTDGQVHEVEIIRNRLHDAGGDVIGLIGISMDITERSRTEESLRLLSTALDAAANAVVITDRDGAIEWVNAAFTTLTGYSREEALGRNPRSLVKSGRHDRAFFTTMWETITAGRIWRGQTVNRRKDGTIYTEDQTITPLTDPAGMVTSFIAIKEDVSALVAAQQALRDSEQRYRQLFEGNPMPMYIFAEETLRMQDANAAALAAYGYTREEFLALSAEEIRPPEEQAYFRAKMEQTKGTQPGYVGEAVHRRKDGSLLNMELHVYRIEYSGRSSRLVLASDNTEKKRLQEQVMRTQRMESIGLLASGIAHDLNNILTPMRMVGPMLRAQILDPDDQRILSLVDHSAERGAALVRQILAFAHGTGSERGPVQLKEVVRDVALFVSETFPKEMHFRHSVPSNLWPANANPTQIHQVLLNLCVNARDAMTTGGTLRLTASNQRLTLENATLIPGGRAGAFVCLEVADTGSGIHPSVLPHIWEPFFTTKSPGKGTGLGLSTVRGIISSHEGFCAVESNLGEGTTFRVYLPALQEPDRDPEAEVAEPCRGSEELVLVVDDEAFVRDAVRDALLKHGYRTLTAHDGIEALRLLELHHPDLRLVVTDLRMPRMGGDRLIAIIRESYPELKIFAMSGDSEPPQLGNGLGPHAFISKPFDLGEFRQVVNDLLQPRLKAG
jgi:PAS domain S-box-containing protein